MQRRIQVWQIFADRQWEETANPTPQPVRGVTLVVARLRDEAAGARICEKVGTQFIRGGRGQGRGDGFEQIDVLLLAATWWNPAAQVREVLDSPSWGEEGISARRGSKASGCGVLNLPKSSALGLACPLGRSESFQCSAPANSPKTRRTPSVNGLLRGHRLPTCRNA